MFDEARVNHALEGANELMAGKYDTGVAPPVSRWNPGDSVDKLIKINCPHVASTKIAAVLTANELQQFVLSVTGFSRFKVWWSQLIIKPSLVLGQSLESSIDFHQDSTYETDWTNDSDLFTFWIALTNITQESAPLRYIKYSHHLGAEGVDIRHSDILARISQWSHLGCSEVSATIPPGHASIHHRHLYHGSGLNRSPSARVSLAFHCVGDHCAVQAQSVYTEKINDTVYCPEFGAK